MNKLYLAVGFFFAFIAEADIYWLLFSDEHLAITVVGFLIFSLITSIAIIGYTFYKRHHKSEDDEE